MPLPDSLAHHDHSVGHKARQRFYAFVSVMDAHILFNCAISWHHHAMQVDCVKSSLLSGNLYEMVLNARNKSEDYMPRCVVWYSITLQACITISSNTKNAKFASTLYAYYCTI
jgi:hypothetical protein